MTDDNKIFTKSQVKFQLRVIYKIRNISARKKYSPIWKLVMTLWIGVDYIDNHYNIVGIENFQVKLMRQFNHLEFIQFIRLSRKAHWVVGIPCHAVYRDILQCQLNTSFKDCHLILKQQYAYDYYRYQFCLLYLGRQWQKDIWRVARVSRDYLQEYLIRYDLIAHQVKIIESEAEAIWIWIYALFKDNRLGAVIYQHGAQIYAFIGKNDLLLDHVVDNDLDSLFAQLGTLSYLIHWICFFNLPHHDVHGYEIKIIDVDVIWRMSMALAYRGVSVGL
jgi:hypothetical protein